MMKSLIVDDEPSARARLARMLTEHSGIVSVVGEARDGLEALERIGSLQPDLVFLDVEMPGLSGFQVLHSLPGQVLPLVIFTTGYDQHALEAFAVNAVTYLLKPIEAERLKQGLERAHQ
ncbi:MAG TPA: response regulator, partial [Blastocatellia bacterium]|nr:response regulator [Blastocatellia bacterium]